MLIRQDFQQQPQLPPRIFVEQIMDDVLKVYCFLWDHKDDENKFMMAWKELSMYYNKNNFRSCLRKLNTEGLLNYEETDEKISIELVGWDELESEY